MFKKISIKLAAGILIAALASVGCNKNQERKFEGPARAGVPPLPQQSIPVDANSIITTTHLTNDKVWLIDGVSYVAPGQTLTIDPGTVLIPGAAKTYNDPSYGPQTIKGVLVVTKGGKLIANGDPSAPIVFTSPNATGRAAGQGASVVILGDAPTNKTNPRIEGIPDPLPASVNVNYGGSNPSDNSGSLQYVRIEFPGYKIIEGNEINGLTLGGVGSGTTLSNIQVSWSADDAFEFFGGTVNADHLIALSNDDDDFDFDFGYSGTITYGISLKDPNSTFSPNSTPPSDANGLESDNDGSGSSATPATLPVLRNFTFVGIEDQSVATNNLKFGNRWRRATSMNIENSIIIGYNTGVSFETSNLTGNFSNNAVHGFTTAVAGTTPANYTGNGLATGSAPSASFAGNPFYTGGGYNAANLQALSGIYATAVGAMGSVDWTLGWSEFDPQNY